MVMVMLGAFLILFLPLLSRLSVGIKVEETHLNKASYYGMNVEQRVEGDWMTWFYRTFYYKMRPVKSQKQKLNFGLLCKMIQFEITDDVYFQIDPEKLPDVLIEWKNSIDD